MDNEGLQLYLLEAKNHKSRYFHELEELRTDLLADNFKSRDYRAAERLLQVFTVLCIGLSKHWVKHLQGHSASEAYQSFRLLKEHGKISSQELTTWKKIIGMRNGLVHDYLNVDPMIVENIIRERYYTELARFVDKVIEALII